MTYFKPMVAVCRKCRADKRYRIYRVRHDLGDSKNRVTILCDHSKPHFNAAGVQNAHVSELLEEVRRRPTWQAPCSNCGRTIHAQGWDPPDDGSAPTVDMLHAFLPSKHPMPINFVCSEKCFKQLLAAQARVRRNARPETTCGHCGKTFTARRGAKYCSTRCRVAAHRASRSIA